MLRPLLVNQSVNLVFDDPQGLPLMRTDEGKVSQILRNFISNALKYTERGHVRVSARLDAQAEAIVFSVADTGIGIAPDDQRRIFDEFAQIDHPLQRRSKGTGLGLPLSKRITELLGGRLWVESEPSVGSTFFASIPIQYRGGATAVEPPIPSWEPDAGRVPVLVIEDEFADQFFYEKILKQTRYQPFAARTLPEARQVLARIRPSAIVLDIRLGSEETWTFLCRLKEASETAAIPVLVATTVDDGAKAMSLGADAYALKPIDRAWLLETLNRLTGASERTRVLVIDDQETMRLVIARFLDAEHYAILEAETGAAGIERARAERPDVILLDLAMPDLDGREVLRRLKGDPETRDVPVVIVTSSRLDRTEGEQLSRLATAIVSKDVLTPAVVADAVRHALNRSAKVANG